MANITRKTVYARGSGPVPEGATDVFFLQEIIIQSEYAMRSFAEIRDRVSAGKSDLSCLAFAQLLLVSAANLSKMFFPSQDASKAAKRRANRLCALTGVGSSSPLASRGARNYLEHFDERMDRHLARPKGVIAHRLVVETLEPTVSIDNGPMQKASYLLALETSTLTLAFWEDRLELLPMAEECGRVQRAATIALSGDQPPSAV